MNSVCLMGRLTGDPELKTTQSGVSVTSFSVAVDRAYTPKGQERQTDFINCVAWRQTAEFITRYFHKGNRIALQGSLQSRSYTTNDGQKRTVYEVVIDNAFFCESKSQSSGTTNYDSQIPQSEYRPQTTESEPAFSTADKDSFSEILDDEELPF